jgi:uncharacterized protein GlcG (DUF336 family)
MSYYRFTVISVSVVDDSGKPVWIRKVNADPPDAKVSNAKAQAVEVFRSRAKRVEQGATRWRIVTTFKDKESGEISHEHSKPTGYSV